MNNINNLKKDLSMIPAIPLDNEGVIIVDGMNMFHRQYHTFGKYPYGTAYGFINTLMKFRTQLSSNKFIVCWDGEKNWRKDANDDYKQTREKSQSFKFTDEERAQFSQALARTKELLNVVGILQVVKDDCEADDLIAYFTVKYDTHVIIVSNDKDFMQFVNDDKNVLVLRPMGKGNYKLCYEEDVFDLFKVNPKDIPKLLAISGDTSDNVKGVRNFGPVKAIKLISEGQITKANIKNVFNKKQLKQFIESYKLVKLGNEKFHSIVIESNDVTKIPIYQDGTVYLEKMKVILKQYDIKRITPVECKLLFNKQFISEFQENFCK